MLHDVISAKYIEDYKIELVFDDGKSGIVDFKSFLARGGVFDQWNDIEFFKNFSIDRELGIITWNHELDVAPETLYSLATGTPLPEWGSANQEIRETA